MPSSSVLIISKCTVYPDQKSTSPPLRLSVSDLPMLSCQYIQKGILLPRPRLSVSDLISHLKNSLSKTLTHFPPLAGRLTTTPSGHVLITCNDAGAEFSHAKALQISLKTLTPTSNNDIPSVYRRFFQLDNMLSYAGHSNPLVSVQLTELNGAVFLGCTVNHAAVDGTSFWNFFNTYAEISRGLTKISRSPDFTRATVFDSEAVLGFPEGGPVATFSGDEVLREKIFHFSKENILKVKITANSNFNGVNGKNITEVINSNNNKKSLGCNNDEISSFQSLCGLLWRCVTRARNLDSDKTTTFRMAVNCRHRLEPRLEPLYFGNAIQSIPTVARVGDLLSNELKWGGERLHRNVVAHDDGTVRRGVKDWESNPRLFPLGNFDGAMITMGSSPRFPMYDNDFGWGRPLAVRSGKANKFDGKISAFPGSKGDGSIDLEVVLAPETMVGLENDSEFMQYVS